jgi:SET domain
VTRGRGARGLLGDPRVRGLGSAPERPESEEWGERRVSESEGARGAQGDRRVRGTGIYPRASMVNHDCLPNVARFDAFDSGQPGEPTNTRLQLRALQDLPTGEEITLSYFPLHWSLEERQLQCGAQYAFRCTCPRCQVGTAPFAREGAPRELWGGGCGYSCTHAYPVSDK